MTCPPRLLGAAFALLVLAPATAAFGAPVSATTNASGRVAVLRSLSILKKADLDFGEVIAAGSGTVRIAASGGAPTPTGSVTIVGSTAHAALFTATGSKNSVVLIRLPQNPVTLTRVGGTETMTVSNWTLDGPTNRKFPLKSAFDFGVGGTLNVGATQVGGTYTGSFTVTVQYP